MGAAQGVLPPILVNIAVWLGATFGRLFLLGYFGSNAALLELDILVEEVSRLEQIFKPILFFPADDILGHLPLEVIKVKVCYEVPMLVGCQPIVSPAHLSGIGVGALHRRCHNILL